MTLGDTGDRCFKSVLVGFKGFSVLESGDFTSISGTRMIDTILKELGFFALPHQNDSMLFVKRHKIVLIRKNEELLTKINSTHWEGSSNNFNHIHNHDELFFYLRDTLKDVADVISMLPDKLSWNEQIGIIHSATVIITPPGGGSFLASFARNGASLILCDKNFKGISVRDVSAVGQDDNWWTHFRRLNIFYYTVCSRDECPGDIVVDLSRMFRLVITALIKVEQEQISSHISDTLKMTQLWRKSISQLDQKEIKLVTMPDICQSHLIPTNLLLFPFPANYVNNVTLLFYLIFFDAQVILRWYYCIL